MVTVIFDLLITLLITEFVIISMVLINSVNTRPIFALSILIIQRSLLTTAVYDILLTSGDISACYALPLPPPQNEENCAINKKENDYVKIHTHSSIIERVLCTAQTCIYTRENWHNTHTHLTSLCTRKSIL